MRSLDEVFQEVVAEDETLTDLGDNEIQSLRSVFMCGAAVAIKELRETPNTLSLSERLDQLEHEVGFEIVKILDSYRTEDDEDNGDGEEKSQR